MQSVFLITIRRLRGPLILIILVFAVSTVGMALIPGVDAQGQPWHMTIFQAFYFVTYTATTIGFGEIPYAFTDQQRLFATLIIYLLVIGWAYLLGAILSLTQDRTFQQALVGARFRRAVAGLREPFYLVCGLGETGVTVVGMLDSLGYRFTAIDRDERRVQALEIEALSLDAPLLAADVRSPETLSIAGLLKPECKAVLALCSDDETNLAVAITACLLRPGLPIIGRAGSPAVAASMTALGTYRVISPFREFGERVALAMRAPDTYRLLAWLTGTPGSYLSPSRPPRMPTPPGHWIICGYGRYGSEVVAAVQRAGFNATIIDPAGLQVPGLRCVQGLGTGTPELHEAGIEAACGLFGGTDDDTTNLAIAIAARRLNPAIFIILRQNLQSSEILFTRFGADMTMVTSQIIATECIAVLRTPLLAEFLDLVRRKGDLWAYSLVESLRTLVGEEAPSFWSFAIEPGEAPGLLDAMDRLDGPIRVGDLTRSAQSRQDRIPCLALLLVRGTQTIELPDDDVAVAANDRLLFAGRRAAGDNQSLMLRNANAAAYVLGNRREAESWVWRAIGRAMAR
ncbi:potassium channel family protein [Rhodopila globiformis]|uniref:KTN NAD-binding domain-containing protein n=1 Tax=Rhodopila globiformis TaxID=1071 RepID=A0A2S6NM30_RHOGL|nr:potassium channel family protein [Rhodopila globiformis]PPQ36789.1 KTN NAD-binding domain-containing protein [Rhodopila globiformis]